MKTALLSDVHGNALALRTVLDELDREGIDGGVCLGDMLQGGPQPAECLALLRERGWPVVLGNADAFLLDPSTAEPVNTRWRRPAAPWARLRTRGSHEPVTEAQLAMRAWSRERLTDAEAADVAAWPLTVELDLGHGVRLLAFHATPVSYQPLLFPTASDEEFRALLGPTDAQLAAGGHTHLQFVRRVGATTFLNPGSVGFGYDHHQPDEGFALDPWASYAVVTTAQEGLRIELRRTAFDGRAVATAIREAGMAHGEARAAMWDRGAAKR